jgi:hypothetical protein
LGVLAQQESKKAHITINTKENIIQIAEVTEKDFVPEYLKYLIQYLCMQYNLDENTITVKFV